MTELALTFKCAHLNLEGRLHLPAEDRGKVPGVVLCHPHPLYGGNMHNNVILAVCHSLNTAGIAALRFNFRGVGSSGGHFDNGDGEQDDARAALTVLAERQEIAAGRLGVMGYSFGGMVTLAMGRNNERVKALAAVSPVLIPGILQGVNKPVFFISGSDDHVVAPQALFREVAGMELPGKVEVVQMADHFWWGHEDNVGRKLAAFFTEALWDKGTGPLSHLG
ncbi:MAG: alpha/beta fold hydrolase [Bacillota bacterium]